MAGLFWIPALLLLAAPEEDLFQQARQGAQQYIASLPNFLCRQTTRREVREAGASKWTLTDVLSAEVAFDGGKEDYRWLLHNGVPVESMDSVQRLGPTSRGEWGSVLLAVFHPDRQPALSGSSSSFRRGTFSGRTYRLAVTHDYSAWELRVNDQLWRPAYDAVVDIDQRLGRAVRIETSGRDFPASFPVASAVLSVEFGLIAIQNQTYLLPVRSVNELCTRSDGRCLRNTIEFFGHRKFQAVSRLVSGDESGVSAQADGVLSRVLAAERARFARAEGRRYARHYLVGEARPGRPGSLTDSTAENISFRKGVEVSAQKDSKQPAAYTAYLETLTELFHPGTRAEFSDGGLYQREPVEVRIYFFRVAESNSRLKISDQGRTVPAAYEGALLVEAATGLVHTFSLKTADLSAQLPVYKVQKAVLFQPDPHDYRRDPVPAQVVDLFWRNPRSALQQETRYLTPTEKR